MKMLVLLIVHNRPHYMLDWLRAWKQCERADAVLYVVNTGTVEQPELPQGDKFISVANDGLDIGAVQRLIQNPPEPYDLIWWGPDDFLPMRSDFVECFRAQFSNPEVGLVGAFWGVNHVRSGAVCFRRDCAEKLRFPPDLLLGGDWDLQRRRCLAFEHGTYNFVYQLPSIGYAARMIDGSTPPNSPDWRNMSQQLVVWDRERMWSDQMWSLFDLTFPL